jgi:hypothetical protein
MYGAGWCAAAFLDLEGKKNGCGTGAKARARFVPGLCASFGLGTGSYGIIKRVDTACAGFNAVSSA